MGGIVKALDIGGKVKTNRAVFYGALQMKTGAAVWEHVDRAPHDNAALPAVIIRGRAGYFRNPGELFRE